ncbi:hypothetical protein SERLA73DRAFT_64146 [Serpula lacrymans var. lacrymans S7.3]|uniref:Uncharacterized protein n=1 Tax=Serpula lacrymans var. lacrymans (strain S7.3) TaxID=936435 RepID=F8QE42_SERL3|nr:hypothetical protein SERLA73DRAFT_64146 [Serpula lacrymans var. lacrymans S7.3]
MCTNLCIAYTGPFAHLEVCPHCNTSWYDKRILEATQEKTKKPKQQFHTIPIGPQIQAFWRDSASALNMQHCHTKTQKLLNELNIEDKLNKYEDFFAGKEYIHTVKEGKVKEGDTVPMFSMDGTQLYEKKMSDCWIYIWVIFDLSSDQRYKKQHVLPSCVNWAECYNIIKHSY